MRALVAIGWLGLVGCRGTAALSPDSNVIDSVPDDGMRTNVHVAITATVNSTRFVVREHMLAAGEMQISGEPLAEAMGRDLGNYSRDFLPPDLYVDQNLHTFWIDLAGFSTGIESYEYSKQPMNNLAFEAGAGTSLVYAPLVNPGSTTGSAATAQLAAQIRHYAGASNALGKFVFANQPLGWPGIWPTTHVFRSFDPTIAPTSDFALHCSITSDDTPGSGGAAAICADYECDATTLHLVDRTAQIDPVLTPGADGFSAWKYGLWVLNYLQVMHDSIENATASVAPGDLTAVGTPNNTIAGTADDGTPTGPGIYLGSSNIEGFQAEMFIAEIDNRAEDWLAHFATDGTALVGFPSVSAALAYDYSSPLRWFPQVAVTETDDGSGFPHPHYTLGATTSELLDVIGMAMGYAEFYALTDRRNAHVGGAQTALVYFDGDPFAADDQRADGEPTLHDRALAIMRVAVIDLDRMHTQGGIVVDQRGGSTISTTSLAYTILGLRTVLRSLGSQLELYSNNLPDTAISHTPLDTLPLHYPGDPTLTFSARAEQLLRAQADLMLDHLTDPSGRAFTGWSVATGAPIDQIDSLDAHTAAIRGLFAAYLATGDVRYRTRAIAVFTRLEAVFYDVDARLYSAEPAPVDTVEYTPLRFALLQSTLRDMYELVAARPGGEALVPVLEDRLARLNKLVLNGWDDRDRDQSVATLLECANSQDTIVHGGLQMAERTLTGECGRGGDEGAGGFPTRDRDADCVPEIDDARLPAALADSITLHLVRSE